MSCARVERSYVAIGRPGDDDGHEIVPDVTLAASRAPETRGPTAAATPATGDPDAAPELMQAMLKRSTVKFFWKFIRRIQSVGSSPESSCSSPSNKRPGIEGLAPLPPQASGLPPWAGKFRGARPTPTRPPHAHGGPLAR